MNLLHSSARRRLTSSLGVLLSLVAVDCLAASPPLLTIGPLDHPAKIDGRIGEGEWDGALPVTAFVRPGGELAAAPFTCRVAYDTKGLVVLWQCEGAPLYERRGHDGSLWQDDAVEVFLMPPDSADYYQFIGSAGGDIYEGKGRDSSWDAQWRFVPAVSAESWQAEMRIPFAAFSRSMPAAGETWRVNFCRDAQKPIIEISSWAPVAKGFHEPESFGHLRFGEAPAPAVMSSLSPSAGHGVTIMPSLRTGGRLQVTLLDGEKQLSAETAADDSPVEINLEHPGSFILRIAGMDEAQQLVFQQEVAVVRKPPLRLTVSKRLLTHRDAQVEMDCSGLEQAPEAYRVTVGEAEPVEVEASAAHRDRATISVDLSSVPAGQEVKLVAAALRGGKVIAQAEEALVVPPVPEWLGSDVGRSDALPAPWTPVVAEGTSVACWGREYRFAERALPAEIVTAGEQILSSPVRLLVNVDGARQRWDQARLRWGETGDTAATGLTTAKSQQAELRAKITAEFDGLMRVDLEVDPVGDAALEEVVLEIPIVAAHARYLHACDASWGGSVSGALPEDDWQHHFMPFVWLGDEERGLQWFCESDAGWRPAKADKVLVVSRHRGAVVLRVNMLEQPLEPGASFRTTFGLQATPVKPIPPEWRQWHITHGAFYGMQDSMVTSNLGVSYPAEGNIDLAQGSVDMWVQPRFDPQVEVERATRGRYNRSLFGVELANGDHWGFYWNIDDRCVRFYNRVGGKVQITLPSRAPQPWKQGEWHHVAFTWGDEAVIYVDGKKVASAKWQGTMPGDLADAKIWLGSGALGRDPCQFVVDNLRVSDAPLDFTQEALRAREVQPGDHTLLLDTFENDFQPDGRHSAMPTKIARAGSWQGIQPPARSRFVEGVSGNALDLGGDTTEVKLLDYLKSKGVNTLVYHESWTEIQAYGSTKLHSDQLHALVKACHEHGIKLLLYFGYELSDAAPEWDLYRDEVLVKPRRGGYQRKDFPQTAYICCYRSPWKEYVLHSIARMMDEYDIDGVYLDGTTEPFGCENESHGCGYVGADGERHRTYPIFAVRDLMRRMRQIIKSRKPDGLISAHMSASVTMPTLAFVDDYWDGEQLDVKQRGFRLAFDAFRAEFMGRNYGVPAEFLSYEARPFTFEEALGIALVHDVLVRPTTRGNKLETMSKVWRIWDEFGVNSARWIPYWQEGGPVTSEAPEVLISTYVKPRAALSVVTNSGESNERISVKIDAEKLGLESEQLVVTDALTGEALGVNRGVVRFRLDPLHMIMLDIH